MSARIPKPLRTLEVPFVGQNYTIECYSSRNCVVKLRGEIIGDDEILSGVYQVAFLDLAFPQEKWKVWIETPDEKGYPYRLHLKGQSAVISADVAWQLHCEYGFPKGGTNRVAKLRTLPRALNGFHMSQKARRLLGLD